MNKISRRVFGISILVAMIVTVFGLFSNREKTVTGIADLLALPEGQTIVARYGKDSIEIDRVTPTGRSVANLSLARKKGSSFLSVVDLSADSDGNLYLLLDVLDAKSGKRQEQQLNIYKLGSVFSKRKQSYTLETTDGRHYRWVDASSQVALMDTDPMEQTLHRQVFDAAELLSNARMTSKGERTYKLAPADGIADAMTVGTSLV